MLQGCDVVVWILKSPINRKGFATGRESLMHDGVRVQELGRAHDAAVAAAGDHSARGERSEIDTHSVLMFGHYAYGTVTTVNIL